MTQSNDDILIELELSSKASPPGLHCSETNTAISVGSETTDNLQLHSGSYDDVHDLEQAVCEPNIAIVPCESLVPESTALSNSFTSAVPSNAPVPAAKNAAKPVKRGSRSLSLKFAASANSTELQEKLLKEHVASRSFKIDENNKDLLAMARRLQENQPKNITMVHYGDDDLRAWKERVDTCDDETLRRWVASRADVITSLTRRVNGEYKAEHTRALIGTTGFDGIVFANELVRLSAVQDLLNSAADPNGRETTFGFTASHAMAWSATLTSLFPESWHLDRIRLLRKAGADNRTAVDAYGRSSLMVALEISNVQFVKSMFRAELGENWALHQLRNVALFSPDGELIKSLLNTENLINPHKSGNSGRPRMMGGVRNESEIKSLLMQGGVRPVFRRPENMPGGVYWAAFHDNAFTIHVLAHLGLPIDVAIENDWEPLLETPLMLACAAGSFNAVEMLLRCNADPQLRNSSGQNAMEIAQQWQTANDALRSIFDSIYTPFRQTLWGKVLCWDSVGMLAKLLDRKLIEVESIEDLCTWYQGLEIDPQDRVAEFWRIACDHGESGVFG